MQYDTDSDSIGTDTRLRWTFRLVADLFVVYNHHVRSQFDRWQIDSNQLLIKLQYQTSSYRHVSHRARPD